MAAAYIELVDLTRAMEAPMSAITPYERIDDLFSSMFPDFFRRPLRADWPALRPPSEMKLDVTEDDKAYVVKAQIPGAKKEDVQVRIDGNVVSIGAEVKEEKETHGEGARRLTRELYYGSLSRSFSLAHEVDDKEARATFVDGVLSVTLPKRASAKGTTLKLA
jgi:HSP20 family protein